MKEQLLLESCGVTLGLCPARPSPSTTTSTTPAPQPGACLSALLRRHVFIRIPAPLRGTAQREREGGTEREGEALFVVDHQLHQLSDNDAVPHEHVAKKAEVTSE